MAFTYMWDRSLPMAACPRDGTVDSFLESALTEATVTAPKTKFVQLYQLCRDAAMAWIDDFAPSMGAAISYYTMFSLAPLLVIVIAVAGSLFGAEAVQGQIAAQLSGLIGQEGALAVQGLVASASEPSRGLIAGSISIAVLIVGATTVFAELQSALDRIWHVPERMKPQGVWGVLRARLLSFGLIMALAFLLMVSLVLSAGLAAFGSWSTGLFPGWEVLLQGLNVIVSFGILTLLFAMIFKFMPSVPIRWPDVWIGAVVTAALFEVGKVLIGLYLGKSGVNESFAAAGSLVVLLAWVYYAAQIFLLGAEFTKVYANAHGSLAGAKAKAATDAAAAQAKAGSDSQGMTVAAKDSETADFEDARRMVEKKTRKAVARLTQQLVGLVAGSVGSSIVSHVARRRRRMRRAAPAMRRSR